MYTEFRVSAKNKYLPHCDYRRNRQLLVDLQPQNHCKRTFNSICTNMIYTTDANLASEYMLLQATHLFSLRFCNCVLCLVPEKLNTLCDRSTRACRSIIMHITYCAAQTAIFILKSPITTFLVPDTNSVSC